MRPVSPVIPGSDLPEVRFAEDQPQYNVLPAIRFGDGLVISRWHMTWRERLQSLWSGDVYLEMETFGHPLQPVKLGAELPDILKTPKPRPFSTLKLLYRRISQWRDAKR